MGTRLRSILYRGKEAVSVISEEMLAELRRKVAGHMSGKRYAHTLGVEAEMRKMAEIYMPEEVAVAAAAGLLHDITKGMTPEEQLAYCAQNGITVSDTERAAPQILHAKTAVHYIEKHFPDFADPVILSAIGKHTTGSPRMTLLDTMLYIADFIEKGRQYASCQKLRAEFWGGMETATDKKRFLDEMLLAAYNYSLEALARMDAVVSPETLHAKEALLARLNG